MLPCIILPDSEPAPTVRVNKINIKLKSNRVLFYAVKKYLTDSNSLESNFE